MVNSCTPFRPVSRSSARHPPENIGTNSRGGNQRKRKTRSCPSVHRLLTSHQDNGPGKTPPPPIFLSCPPSHGSSLRPASVQTPSPPRLLILGSISIPPPPLSALSALSSANQHTVSLERQTASPCLPLPSIPSHIPRTPRFYILISEFFSVPPWGQAYSVRTTSLSRIPRILGFNINSSASYLSLVGPPGSPIMRPKLIKIRQGSPHWIRRFNNALMTKLKS